MNAKAMLILSVNTLMLLHFCTAIMSRNFYSRMVRTMSVHIVWLMAVKFGDVVDSI